MDTSDEFLSKMNYDFGVFLSKMKQILPTLPLDQVKYIPQWLIRIRPAVTEEEAILRQIFVTKIKEGVTNKNFHPIFLKAPPMGPLNAIKHYFNIDEAISKHYMGEETQIDDETVQKTPKKEQPPKGVTFITSSMVPQCGAFLHLSIMTPKN